MAGFKADQYRAAGKLAELDPVIAQCVQAYPVKFWWFTQQGYYPHTWQILFHAAENSAKLTRFRHLVAGRRGGKTLSAAWEVLFYAMHPKEFHRDAHAEDSDEPLWIWALAKDFKIGRPSLITFLKVLNKSHLVKDVDYTYNKSEKVFEFKNGTLVEFKTADDPESLRGAGLDILWIDEAAFIPTDDAWNVVYPALSDKQGLVVTTTTPKGKNWFHDMFWSKAALEDVHQFRVEYTSIDNPYFKREEWEYALKTYHPLHFKQEFMAAFDAMAGVELSGDWLKYFVLGKDTQLGHSDDVRLIPKDGSLGLEMFIGVDPAISTAETADRFAMAAIGVNRDTGMVYLVEIFADRIPFPDQLMKIQEWHLKYRPRMIGIEANAYQRALVQQAYRLPGMPNISAVFSKGKKHERILAMSPLFKTGRVRLHRKHRDFIDEWVSYDSKLRHPKDDVLDAVEIGLGVAGVLLPRNLGTTGNMYDHDKPASDSQELAERELAFIGDKSHKRSWDPDMGEDY